MDRLTKMNKFPNGDKEYVVDTKLASNREAIQRLAYFEDLEEQGLLIKLPYKVGDVVWGYNVEGKIIETWIHGFSIVRCSNGYDIEVLFPICDEIRQTGYSVHSLNAIISLKEIE